MDVVKIISTSTEIIKPSCPTPPHLKTYTLSLLDQFNIDGRYPMMLFYSSGTTQNSLKKSLAQTLSYYYPYAGRVNLDGCSIDCDDSGAPFIEAHVANTMSEILQRLEFDVLVQLLPFKNDPNKLHANNSIIVVQVNYFSCGGVAITLYFKHVIADGPASINFIKAWSDNNHNQLYTTSTINKDHDVVFDCASVFPPQDLPLKALWKNCFQVSVPLGEALVKRFTFDGTKMAALQAKIGDNPTRFEAVTTLILAAAADAARERETDDVKPKNVALIPINIRKRMNPPFPEKCLGNVGQATVVKWQMEERIEYNSFAKRIRESIRKMDDKYARKLNETGGFLNDLENVNEEISKMNVYFVSSLCRSGLYEADFGWGKAVWANVVLKHNNVVVISDTSDGQGIEAWVGLPKQDMATCQNNQDILAYASFI